MMFHFFPELKERDEYNTLKARASNVLSCLLETHHIIENDHLYNVYKNANKDEIQIIEKLFGEFCIDYMNLIKEEEIKTGKSPEWVRHVKQ